MRARGTRGASLIEVMVAMLIFAFVMLGIMQMFAYSFMLGVGARARTEMTYKAQQVMEHIKYLRFLSQQSPPVTPTGSPYCGVVPWGGASVTMNLPLQTTDPGWAYWGTGAGGATVMERPVVTLSPLVDQDPAYTIAVVIAPVGSYYNVTVNVQPNTGTGSRATYVGSGNQGMRGVQYVEIFQ